MTFSYKYMVCVALVIGVSGQPTTHTCTSGSQDDIGGQIQQLQTSVSVMAERLKLGDGCNLHDSESPSDKVESDCYTDMTSREQYRVRVQGHLMPCEPTYGGWLVFVRRVDGSENFYRSWNEYADGFGDWRREFWLGNQRLHEITSQGGYRLRAEMEDWSGMRYWAEYGTFRVASREEFFQLTVGDYNTNSTAGDSMSLNKGMKFTTRDLDQDGGNGNCAVVYKGGWWYNLCFRAHPTGLYRDVTHTTSPEGIKWHAAGNDWRSFRFMELKLQKAHV